MVNSFKIGDKVKILPRNDSTKYFPSYVDSMQKYTGQFATVTIVTSDGCRIDLDNGYWNWPFNALELITSETDETVDFHKLKNGDYIKLTSASCENTSLIYIIKEVKDNVIYRHASYSLRNKDINIDSYRHWFVSKNTEITYATEEEKRLFNNALLEQGYWWNSVTNQLENIGLINLSAQPVNFSLFRNSIQKATDVTNLLSCTEKEPQTEIELNLFPKKKHYQLNFNY